ncbi:MAG: hypothetical protein V4621_05185 [Pseudomonadota bacterium]
MLTDGTREVLETPNPKMLAEAAFKSAWEQATTTIANDIVRRGLSQQLSYSFHPDKETFATGQSEDSAWHCWLLNQERGASPAKAYAVMQTAVNQANNALLRIYASGPSVSYKRDGTTHYTFIPKPTQ